MTKICIVKQTDKEKACLLIGKVGNKAVQRWMLWLWVMTCFD
jgi:hypothetical protein